MIPPLFASVLGAMFDSVIHGITAAVIVAGGLWIRHLRRQRQHLIEANQKLQESNQILQTVVRVKGDFLYSIARGNKLLRQTNEKLQQLDQLKTDFLSTVSHELRTPLTSVLGFASVTHRQLQTQILPLIAAPDPKTQRVLREIQENFMIIESEGKRLTALLNDILDISKLESGQLEWNMQPIQIDDILQRAFVSTSTLLANKGLHQNVEIYDPIPATQGDPNRLMQVMINLIANAVKFTEVGSVTGRVEVKGELIQVSIIDTGIGIDPADQEWIFDRFKQVGRNLTDKPMGSGLGLTICKQIVERHGGTIWVESKLGAGSLFAFTIPHVNPPDPAQN